MPSRTDHRQPVTIPLTEPSETVGASGGPLPCGIAFKLTIEPVARRRTRAVLRATLAGEEIGVLIARQQRAGIMEIGYVNVEQPWQRRGVASELLVRVRRWGLGEGAQVVHSRIKMDEGIAWANARP